MIVAHFEVSQNLPRDEAHEKGACRRTDSPRTMTRTHDPISVVTRLRVGVPRFDSRQGQVQGFFSLHRRVQTSSEAHPAS